MWEKGETHQAPSTLVLVAALNEEEGIGLTLAELKLYLPDSMFLVVDGWSTDRTVHAAKNQGAEVLYQKGKGKGDAISCGLKKFKSDFDFVIITDADFTYPAKYIPKMIKILETNPTVGMVCGNRFNSEFHLSGMQDLFYFGNRILSLIHNLVNGVNLRDPLTGMRAIRWNIMKNWRPKSKGFDLEVELNHHVEKQGYEIAEIAIPYRVRIGEKKLKARDGLQIMKRILLIEGNSINNSQGW